MVVEVEFISKKFSFKSFAFGVWFSNGIEAEHNIKGLNCNEQILYEQKTCKKELWQD